jgi:gliding motility-associated-like protein
VSGGSVPYSWSASPADPSLTAPNSANPTVSPTQTTVYTVTSTATSNTNLAFNGNFSLGNLGFNTVYAYYNAVNPTLAQRAYGIVSNPNAWESGFTNCPDHTTGTGQMMVLDGSAINSGNDLVWGQNIAVLPFHSYTFSYWIQSVVASNPAVIRTTINGVVQGTGAATNVTCGWTQYSYVWNSGAAALAQIQLFDQTLATGGNDFALDDISFTTANTCSLSKTVTVTVASPLAAVLNCGTSTANSVTFNWAAVSGAVNYNVSYSINSGQPVNFGTVTAATYTAAGLSPNDSVTITVTPLGGGCFASASQTCLTTPPVNCTPDFAPIPAFCSGTVAPILALISPNGISGTWSPPTINNTASGTYVFTPNGACAASTQTLTVTVTPIVVSNFAAIPTFCAGSNVPLLAATSPNGITGTWFPAIVNNMASGIYTFTPNAGQCAAIQVLNVTVASSIAPDFAQIPAFCSGSAAPVLATTSPNGITGIWSPATVSNTTSGAYTFTPSAGQCGTTQVVNIIVTPTVTPDFAEIPTFCSGATAPILAATSPNGISGTWSPATISNTLEGAYTFTPNAGQCATQQVLNVTLASPVAFNISGGCQAGSYVLQAFPSSGTFDLSALDFQWSDEAGNPVGLNQPMLDVTAAIGSTSEVEEFPSTYGLTISENGGCGSYEAFTVENVYCMIPKGVSHNGDYKNDYFDLSNLGVTHLAIYNRYGTKVYSRNSYTNQWGGQSDNGKQLPDATYYYYLEFENGNPQTGWVYLISK